MEARAGDVMAGAGGAVGPYKAVQSFENLQVTQIGFFQYYCCYYHSSFLIASSRKIIPEIGNAPVFIKVFVIYLKKLMFENL